MSTQTSQPGAAPWDGGPSAEETDRDELMDPGPERHSLPRDLLTPVILLAFATYLAVNLFLIEVPDSTDFPGPRFFPGIIAGIMYVLTLMDLIRVLRGHRQRPQGPAACGRAADRPGFDWAALAWTVGGFIVFIATLRLLGWILAAAVLFWFVARGFGNRSPLTSFVVGLTISSLAYIGFDMGLGLNLPSGILGGAF